MVVPWIRWEVGHGVCARALSERLVYFRLSHEPPRAGARLGRLRPPAGGAHAAAPRRPWPRLFGAPPPEPLINAQLNGLFTLTLGLGYFWAAGDVEGRRGYFWIAGVLAKGLGAALFVLDHFMHGSPRAFLLFALSDGTLAVVTLLMLWRRPARRAPG